MPEKPFQVEGMYNRAYRPPEIFEPVRFNVQATDIIGALKIVAEGRTVHGDKLYSANVYGTSDEGHAIHGRYLSEEASRDMTVENIRKKYAIAHMGRLMDVPKDQIKTKPRIELRKVDVWVPLEELTETGWAQIKWD